MSPSLERPDGTKLHHETHGDPEHPPVILLEGMGGDIPGWRRNIPHLASRLFVVAYDFRGNGGSEMRDEPVTMATFVDDTVALLDTLGASPAHVYGQSFGGMVAQEMVLTHPGSVRSLILGCTHAGHAHMVASTQRAPKDRPWELLYAPGFPEAQPEHVADDLRSGSPQRAFARKRQWEVIQDWDSWERLPDIQAPTLVLHGSEDRMIHPDNARMLAERIPGGRLALIEGAGHVYHSERAEEADRLVLEFVEEVESKR